MPSHGTIWIALTDQPAANATPEAGQRPGHIGQPDRQALDMLDGGIDHAHGQNHQIELYKWQFTGRHDRGDGQCCTNCGKHRKDAVVGPVRNDNPHRISQHKGGNSPQQFQGMAPVTVLQ